MYEITKYAPIVIPTLCRFEHFKRCIESLSKCTHAEKTKVFIGLDYPLKEVHKKGYKLISEYLENCNLSFEEIIVIKRPENFGVVKNIDDLRNQVFKVYDRLIVSEDDNEFSPNFLDFINKGLEKFKDDDSVMAISGYNYPVEMISDTNNFYTYSKYSAWGCGLWNDKYAEFKNVRSLFFLKKILSSPISSFKFLIERPNLILKIISCVEKQMCLGDVCWESYLLLNNKTSVFPTLSKVRNHGHDGSGVNCGVICNDIFCRQKVDIEETFTFSSSSLKMDYVKKRMKNYPRKITLRVYLCSFCKFILHFLKRK